jgi:hypothetical protein
MQQLLGWESAGILWMPVGALPVRPALAVKRLSSLHFDHLMIKMQG